MECGRETPLVSGNISTPESENLSPDSENHRPPESRNQAPTESGRETPPESGKQTPPESARTMTRTPARDLLTALTQFRLSTAISRENLNVHLEDVSVTSGISSTPAGRMSPPRRERIPWESNRRAEERWKTGSCEGLDRMSLTSWRSRVSLCELGL